MIVRLSILIAQVLAIFGLSLSAGIACLGTDDGVLPPEEGEKPTLRCLWSDADISGLEQSNGSTLLQSSSEECNPLAVKERIEALVELIRGKFIPNGGPVAYLEKNGLRVPVYGSPEDKHIGMVERGLYSVFSKDVVDFLRSEGSPIDQLKVYVLTRDIYRTIIDDDLQGLTWVLNGCTSDMAIGNFVLGYYHPNIRSIVLVAQDGYLDGYTVAHESGHALDNLLTSLYRWPVATYSPTQKFFMLSLSSGVNGHFSRLKGGVPGHGEAVTAYAKTNIFEYFAESIAQHLTVRDAQGYPMRLIRKDPLMYAVLRSFFDDDSALYFDRDAFSGGRFDSAFEELNRHFESGIYTTKIVPNFEEWLTSWSNTGL